MRMRQYQCASVVPVIFVICTCLVLACGPQPTEWVYSPTETPLPTNTIAPNPPSSPEPIPTPTATRLPLLLFPLHRAPSPTPIPPTPTPTPTPPPTSTPTLILTATPIPTTTPVPLTVGEKQLEWFEWQCEAHGVALWSPLEQGDMQLGGKIVGQYLMNHYSDHPNTVLADIEIAGSVWETRWIGIPLDSDGAYSEGGTCLLVATSYPHGTWHPNSWEPDYTTTVRLESLDGANLTEDELTFGEGYHFLSKEEGYIGRFAVRMWWTGEANVPQEDRRGEVILFNFWSAGPGRQRR